MASGNEKKPAAIVALHGFLGLPSDWDSVFTEDFTAEFPVEAVDLWPSTRELYSTNGFADWSRAFLSQEETRSQKPILLGYSMGGRLAMHAALRAPEKWAGAVFVSAHPGLASFEERVARTLNDQKWAQRFLKEPWDDVIRDWNSQAVLQPPGPELAPEAIPLKPRLESEFDRQALALAMQFWSLGNQTDLRERLRGLPIPILFVTGELDTKFTSLIRDLKLPEHHRHEVVARAGHRVPWDQPQAFREVVRRFCLSL